MASTLTGNIEGEVLHGPHIPGMTGEFIDGFSLFGIPISTTVFSTWLFMIFLGIILFLFNYSLKTGKLSGIKNTGLIFIDKIDAILADFIGDKIFARKAFFLVVGIFIFVLLGNIFSLALDWLALVSYDHNLAYYIRPINADLNTTLVLTLIVILLAQVLAIKSKGAFGYLKGYLFNFEGNGLLDKSINVFVGWLHLIGEFSKLLSLSLRLFGNIFAGIVLISVMAFLTGSLSIFGLNIGEIAVLPFWLFELFVAFIQAVVFFVLTSVYFKEARSHH